MQIKSSREPLFHLVKRDKIPWWKAWLIRIGAILLALVARAVISELITGVKPKDLFTTIFRKRLYFCA